MCKRNLLRNLEGELLDTFDEKSLRGARSDVGYLGITSLSDIVINFLRLNWLFGPSPRRPVS